MNQMLHGDGRDQGQEEASTPLPAADQPTSDQGTSGRPSESDMMYDDSNSGSHEWIIENWLSITESKLYGEEFDVGGYSWRILMFPRGNAAPAARQLSLFLDCPEAEILPINVAPRADFKLYVRNQLDPEKDIVKETQHNFNGRESDWGFSSFCNLVDIEEPGAGFLVKDRLVVAVSINVHVQDKYMYDCRRDTSYVGLKNQGATCYMNSMLQTLYHIPFFRKAVFHIPTQETENPQDSITMALQKVFYQLQYSPSTVSTKDLTSSFGWNGHEAFQQHDVQEFNRILCDRLEHKMKGTAVEKTITELFEGKLYWYTECLNVDYQSVRVESFMDLQLDVKGCRHVYDSFDKYIQVETMDGDNKYHAEGHGLQAAKRGVLFQSFPPVLQLHLKRFEYDFIRDSMTKINDRYEFPEVLDLDHEDGKYLSPEARNNRAVRNCYRLHSVLVHSGGLHGGHYYAFVQNDKHQWLKFDDERVTKEDSKKALADQFGGDDDNPPPVGGMYAASPPSFKMTKYSNAYMLVYIREDDWEYIMCDVNELHIAAHFRARMLKEQEEKEMRRQEKLSAHRFCQFRVFTSQDFKSQIDSGKRHFDLVDPSSGVLFRVPKNTLFEEFQDMVHNKLGVAPASQRFWRMQYRQNNTFRPAFHVPNAPRQPLKFKYRDLLKDSKKCPSSVTKHGPYVVDLWCEELSVRDSSVPLPDPNNSWLLFIKWFDHDARQLRYHGHILVPGSTSLQMLMGWMAEQLGLQRDVDLRMFEEVKEHPKPRIDDQSNNLANNLTVKQVQLQSGDILIFQEDEEVVGEDCSECGRESVVEFLEYIAQRVVVNFRPLEQPKHEGVKVELSRDDSYEKAMEKLAEKLQVADPQHLRLTRHNVYAQAPQLRPDRYNSFNKLEQVLAHQSGQQLDILYYEVLDMPLPQLELLGSYRISFHNSKTEFVVEHTVRVSKDKKVGSILAELAKMLGDKVGDQPLRLLKVHQCRIFQVVDPEKAIEAVNLDHNYWYLRAEIVPPDQHELDPEHDEIIHVYHFKRSKPPASPRLGHKLLLPTTAPTDVSTPVSMSPPAAAAQPAAGGSHAMTPLEFGDPFLFRVGREETLRSIRERLQAKLGISDEDFAKWKVAYIETGKIEELPEDCVPWQLFQRASTASGHHQHLTDVQPYLGLEHEDTGYSKRSARSASSLYTAEKAITMRS